MNHEGHDHEHDHEAHEHMSEDGLRVLAVAYRWLEPRVAYSREDETDLVLAGFVSFADPVLPDVADVLAELERDGITVKILTGDNERVARTLDSLRQAARGGDNTMYPLLDCVRAYATVGEMCDALREVWGEYEEVPLF